MPYTFRLEPDDGGVPLELEFDLYHTMFPALVRADLSLFQPLKRFRGAHAFVVIPRDAFDNARREVASIRHEATDPHVVSFLDGLVALLDRADAAGAGVRGGQPYPWDKVTPEEQGRA